MEQEPKSKELPQKLRIVEVAKVLECSGFDSDGFRVMKVEDTEGIEHIIRERALVLDELPAELTRIFEEEDPLWLEEVGRQGLQEAGISPPLQAVLLRDYNRQFNFSSIGPGTLLMILEIARESGERIERIRIIRPETLSGEGPNL